MKIFVALGNDRPPILVRLEDCVLKAIISISEGSRENAMDTLYSEISPMEKDLANDKDAMTWFNLSMTDSAAPAMPTPYEIPSTPLPGESDFFFLSPCLTSMEHSQNLSSRDSKVSVMS